MTAAEAYHGFWAQFGIPAFEEGAAPQTLRGPCVTYRYAEGSGDGENADLSASVWVWSSSWREVWSIADRIGEALPRGGMFLPFEGGTIWLRRGTPWQICAGDGEDPLLRRAIFNIKARFYRA